MDLILEDANCLGIKLAFTGSELLGMAGLGEDHAGNCSTYLYRKDHARSRFLFRTQCNEGYSKGPWTSRVMFIGGRSGSREFTDLRVWCNCSFWKYWGPMYNAVMKDFDDSDRKVVKPPNIRDKGRNNHLCKHLINAIPIALGERDAYYDSLEAKRELLRRARIKRELE